MYIDIQNNLVQTLDTERLHLRPFTESDAKDLYEYASDELTIRHLTWAAHTDVEDSKRIIRTLLSNRGTYAIVFKESGKMIGCIDLRIQTETEASFGYVMNRAYWNKGYASEALRRALSYLFSDLGIEIVQSCHEKKNPASGSVMKKCGMRWTHLAEQETLFGKTTDNDHYCITKAEWLKEKAFKL